MTIAHGGNFAQGDFSAIPTMPDFNPMTLLHGEESVIVERPFKPNAKYIIQEEVKDF